MPTNTSFSSGFAAGGTVINRRQELAELKKENFRKSVAERMTIAKETLKGIQQNLEAIATSKESTQAEIQTANDAYARSRDEVMQSMGQVFESGGDYHTPSEKELAMTQLSVGSQPRNIAAAQQVESQGKALNAGAEAEATLQTKMELESQKQEAVQKQFLNDANETVTQTKDGRFIDTQGNVITDVSKLNNLRNIPTTQNINQTNLTPANTTDIEGDQLAGEQIAFEARELAERLTSADVGFRGAAGELLLDELLGQFIHSAVNKDRVKNRQAIRTMREKALRTMTTDNRLNREDRAGVEKIFPKDSVVESLPAAREKLTSLAELMEERSARAAGLLNRKATHLMSTEEIKSAVLSGEMNRDQGLRALRTYHGFE